MPRCIRESIIKFRDEFIASENKRRKILSEGLKLEEAMALRINRTGERGRIR